MSERYAAAGVSIDAGDVFVEKIRPFAQQTQGPEVLAGIGGFAAHYLLDKQRWTDPVLVACTDGVGTKLRVAIEARRWDSIGIDLVAMCVNDLVCSGATPLFFLDYLATAKLQPTQHAVVVQGIATACRQVGCALIGGETAEMPGMYQAGDFDLAGFSVGVVERRAIIDGQRIAVGDAIIGLASSGFHSNGYSLVRQVIQERGLGAADPFPGMTASVAEVLLQPTVLYSPLVLPLCAQFDIRGIAHITGGGLTGNLPRILPSNCQAQLDPTRWPLPPPFAFIQEATNMPDEELRRVFNCGIGMALVVPAAQTTPVLTAIAARGQAAWCIGHIVARPADAPAICYA